MQKRRPERIRPGEVMVKFETEGQAKINRQVLGADGVKFRVSSKLSIFLPSKRLAEELAEKYGSLPISTLGDLYLDNVLIKEDDYYIDNDGAIQMINKEAGQDAS